MTKYLAIAFLITGFGCASAMKVSYMPIQGIEPLSREVDLKIFINAFDNSENISESSLPKIASTSPKRDFGMTVLKGAVIPSPYYHIPTPFLYGSRSSVPGTTSLCSSRINNCPQLFKDVFAKEFKSLGLQVVENINEAQVVMKGKILRFESGSSWISGLTGSGRVHIELKFFDQNGKLVMYPSGYPMKYDFDSLDILVPPIDKLVSSLRKRKKMGLPSNPFTFGFDEMLKQESLSQEEKHIHFIIYGMLERFSKKSNLPFAFTEMSKQVSSQP